MLGKSREDMSTVEITFLVRNLYLRHDDTWRHLVYLSIVRSEILRCKGLDEKEPSDAQIFEHLVPNWWHCLGRFWNV